MSKIIPIFFMCLALTFNCANYIDFKNIFIDFDGSVEIHTNCFMNVPYTQVIPNGKSYIMSTDLKYIDLLLQNLNQNNIRGYTFFLKTTDTKSIINRLSLQYFKQNGSEIIAYSNIIPLSINVDNKIYNTHIVTKKDEIVIGFPVILGSY